MNRYERVRFVANRHELYEVNMSTSAILDFPKVALFIVD